ncbi:hypothetical protein E2C01_070208 [Portunus trituberculatus]|uniref:Uncharacterized protein n=1 Tax=Portunus trituberculatus TaxID=210409 RepID=A0A5B7HWN5_PORTR|nr:hypothetical protein [Portunus trituberculatus]
MKVWERLKAKAKQDDTEFKRAVRKTGGGPPPTLPDDTAKVIGIISSEVNDLGCTFDCDTGWPFCSGAAEGKRSQTEASFRKREQTPF